MPTSFGFAFAGMALVVFFMAVGYSNNLIYIFVFLLISLAITSAFVTNQNIKSIQVLGIKASDLFANEEGGLTMQIKNTSSRPAWDLEILYGKDKEIQAKIAIIETTQKDVTVKLKPVIRGWQNIQRMTLQSRFPFQLLRAWKYYSSVEKVLVFPERRGDIQFPREAYSEDALANAGLFRDHRNFQSSDSVNRIDWRASARRQNLFVKNYEEAEKPVLSFTWEQTQSLEDFEKRLSQLSLWIDQAYVQQHDFSLKLGKKMFPLKKDYHHRCQCLEALALFEKDQL